jgi:hypothetical protein
MRHLDRAVGIAVIVVGTAMLSACSNQGPARTSMAAQMAALPSAGMPTTGLELADRSGSKVAKLLAPYRPPPSRAEIPPPAPSPQALWEHGHWRWSGAQYVWVRGHYIERPEPYVNWIPGYWQQQADGWAWVDGRWT